MSTDLTKHLWPQGRSTTEPDLMPNVLDSDGNTVKYSSSKRKTTEATVVNLGDSPNSNNGDPLRTAFAKINNFIEASYWTNEGINQKFRQLDSELNEGFSFYTDSEVRYSVSSTEDSKLYFRGNPNQIELNVTKKHSANNPNDWDSEVNLTFNLTETVNVNNLVVGRDSDDTLIVNARIASNLLPYGNEIYNLGDSDNKWKDLYLSGNTIYLGSIQIKNSNNREITFVDSDGKGLNFSIATGKASNFTIDSDLVVDGLTRLLGDLSVKQKASFDSDILVIGTATTNNLTVSNYATFRDRVTFKSGVTFDSDLVITGTIFTNKVVSTDPAGAAFDSVVTFENDVIFKDNARFDSDVIISGSLTVNGTTTYVNTNNLEVNDNLIVLNKNQTNPLNDTGIIFQRYDSDLVTPTNTNAVMLWNETDDQFVIGQTSSSGINTNPTIQEEYITIGNTIEMFDSDGVTRLIWNKQHARLSILNKDGSEAFAFDADSGQMEGNGTIDAGFF